MKLHFINECIFESQKSPVERGESSYIYNINIDILDSSHALCACNEALFYFLFWVSEIMFKSEIKIVS